MLGTDERDYYDIVEEIYELNFECHKAPNLVIFICHWFNLNDMRTAPEIEQVKIWLDSIYQGEDVYICWHLLTPLEY